MALGVLAFPINTQAQKEQIIFMVDNSLSQPRVVYRPYPSEFKKVTKKQKAISTHNAKALSFDPCNCWSYVYYRLNGNMPIGYGFARNYPVNSLTPRLGGIIITYESKAGHMGIIAGVDDKYVTIDDYNYKRCGHTVRKLARNSPLIKGYII